MHRLDDRPPYQANRGSRSKGSERSTSEWEMTRSPPEFLEPEGDAERQDPDLVFETTSATLRSLWKEWMCEEMGRSPVSFFDAGW